MRRGSTDEDDDDTATSTSDAEYPGEQDEGCHDEQDEDGTQSDSDHNSEAGASEREGSPVEEGSEAQRRANIRAMLSNNLETQRAPVMSRYLSVNKDEAVLKKAFVSPVPGAPAISEDLKRKITARKRWVPWGSSQPWVPPTLSQKPAPLPVALPDPVPEPRTEPPPPPPPQQDPLPEGIEPLILWAPPDVTHPTPDNSVMVDSMLVKWLRPHQREGVAFMFECVAGLRLESGRGCILADDMGLGKTLQGLSLVWTLSTSGHDQLGGKPMARRSLIVCPTSLVGNWASEAKKWLLGRMTVLALCEASKDDVQAGITDFLHPRNPYKVLILSYETFRINAGMFKEPGSCDLLLCDEAHRLKNEATLTNRALDSLPCKRRVLLSGTPMQNHLDEFFAMVDFCNPGVLETPSEFRRRFEAPILAGREPGAPPEVVEAGQRHSAELSTIVNNFILRRTNTLLSAHLPPKVVMVVCCKLTPLQRAIYHHFLESKAARKILGGKGSNAVLPAIGNLKKLCNHPKLIYDAIHSRVAEEERTAKGSKAKSAAGFEGVAGLFPPCLFDDGRPGRGGMALGWESTSGKFGVAARMLALLWDKTDDKIVLVSNYTQTLDLFAQLCRERGYPMIRLDGSTSVAKREKLVQAFNDPAQRNFIFLLSSKAGGCGLNLVGANRLMLFDCDWNPAVDKQAAARVWRDGQKRRVYVYRMLATGTIEEKVFQRQISKEGLQALVNNKGSGGGGAGSGKAARNLLSAEELRELFTLHEDTPSHTWEVVRREARAEALRAAADAAEAGDVVPSIMELDISQGQHIHKPQEGSPTTEEELSAWGHHTDPSSVPDLVLQHCAGHDVSFVFSCQVAGKSVEETVFQPRALGPSFNGPGSRKPLAGVKRPPPQPLDGPNSIRQAPAATTLLPPSLSGAALQGQQVMLPPTAGPAARKGATVAACTSGIRTLPAHLQPPLNHPPSAAQPPPASRTSHSCSPTDQPPAGTLEGLTGRQPGSGLLPPHSGLQNTSLSSAQTFPQALASTVCVVAAPAGRHQQSLSVLQRTPAAGLAGLHPAKPNMPPLTHSAAAGGKENDTICILSDDE